MGRIHDRRSCTHINRHAERFQDLLAAGALLDCGLGVEGDAVVAAHGDADRERDREELDDLDELAEELKEADEDIAPAPKSRGEVKEGRSAREALPAERGRLRFEIQPADAAVYLDDEYIGTGRELAGLRRGVPADAGKHTVSVVRPGFVTKTIEVEAKPGAAIDVVVELEK